MSRLCATGSEPKIGENPASRIYFDDGIFCAILSVRHPLCVLIDRVWHTIAAVLDVANPSDAPREASKFAWSFARAFGNAALEDSTANGISVGELCASEPIAPNENVTYLDLVQFLAGESDAILEKLRAFWRYRAWFEHCQCRPYSLSLPPTTPLQLPEFVFPSIPWCGGIIAPPSQGAIADCLSSLLAAQQSMWDYAVARWNDFQLERTVLLSNPPEIGPPSQYQIGDCYYSGQTLTGWREFVENGQGCSDQFPRFSQIDVYRKTCQFPNWQIEFAWGMDANYHRLQEGIWAYGDWTLIEALIPDCPASYPDGTVFGIFNERNGIEPVGICWYAIARPLLSGCAQGGQSGGFWNSPPYDPDGDDRAVCLQHPSLCQFRKPCCRRSRPVLVTPSDQLALARAFGFDTSQYEV